MAMSRVPGESLDSYLRRPPPPGQNGPSSVRRGCALASQLIRQLGPTLERIAPHAWHRDVNSHNVLMSDGVDGGRARVLGDLEETSRRASFWLIDFGLAVDSTTWPLAWQHSDVAGDCRYWPPSSFLMSFYGPEEVAAHQDMCSQYKMRLDIVGLGLTALEVLCATALASSHTWGPDGLRGSWRRLFLGWQRYREEVTRWHTMIFQVFSAGGDIGPLYQQLSKEHVVDKVAAHVATVRTLLRACTQRTEDLSIQRLLAVIADMIDERSSTGLREAVEALGPGSAQASVRVAAHTPVSQTASFVPPSQVVVPQAASYTPPPQVVVVPQTASYTPPPQVVVAHAASYTPPPAAAAVQVASYTPPLQAAMPQASSHTQPPQAAAAIVQAVPRVSAAPVRCAPAAEASKSVPHADLDTRDMASSQFQRHPPAAASHCPARLVQRKSQDLLPPCVGTKGVAVGDPRRARPHLAGA